MTKEVQKAIDFIHAYMHPTSDSEYEQRKRKYRDMAIQALEKEPKTGHWIIDDKEGNRIWHCHCSECNKDPQDYIGGTENWWLVRLPNNCPNCGADMRGEKE